MTPHAHRAEMAQAGFTLVEMLVAMTLTLLIASAALGAFEAFDRGVASSSRLTDAQDTARRELGVMVHTLREAGTPARDDGVLPIAVTRTHDTDIVFRSRAWPGAADTGSSADHLQRYCLNTATKILWFDAKHANTIGDSDPGTACPSTANGWTRHRVVARNVINAADSAKRLFAYTSRGGQVRSVQISLRLDGGSVASSRELRLASGASVRGALGPQVTEGDVSGPTCAEPGRALLSLNVGGDPLSVIEQPVQGGAQASIPVGPGKILVAADSETRTVRLVVTDPLGLQTVLFKTVSPCP
jgi:prepilin-type N-terminal cleavage/methylation domain-containing protein